MTTRRPASPCIPAAASPSLRRPGTRFAANAIVVLFLTATAACAPDPEARLASLEAEAARLEAEGRREDALEALKGAIALAPDRPDLRENRARLYLAGGRAQLAEVELEKALALGSPRPALLADLAEVRLAQGHPREALATLDSDPLPEDPLDALRALDVRARSLLAIHSTLPEELLEAWIAMLTALDRLPAPLRAEPAVGALVERTAALRARHPAVERAFQHHGCRSSPARTYGLAERDPETASSPGAAGAGRVLVVGRGNAFANPAAAARVARDGDTVEIRAGQYPGGVAVWPQSNLTIRGVGGRPRITASGQAVEGRDVWLFTGDRVRVDNVEISGARARAGRNGAALRHMGSGLVIRRVFLHDNENGLLVGNRHPDSTVTVEHSEFADNGHGDGYSHNVYVGHVGTLVFRFNHSRRSRSGHLLKSRAARNLIVGNRLDDGNEGRSSYLIDLPNGGIAVIAGNLLRKSPVARNPALVAFAAEGATNPVHDLRVINNTVYNGYFQAIAVKNDAPVDAIVANNVFAGAPVMILKGPGTLVGNAQRPDHGLVNARDGDYRLGPDSPLVDAAAETGALLSGLPFASGDIRVEYVEPVAGRDRLVVGQPDIGAFEYCRPSPGSGTMPASEPHRSSTDRTDP